MSDEAWVWAVGAVLWALGAALHALVRAWTRGCACGGRTRSNWRDGEGRWGKLRTPSAAGSGGLIRDGEWPERPAATELRGLRWSRDRGRSWQEWEELE